MLNAIFDFNGTMFFDETFQEKASVSYTHLRAHET